MTKIEKYNVFHNLLETYISNQNHLSLFFTFEMHIISSASYLYSLKQHSASEINFKFIIKVNYKDFFIESGISKHFPSYAVSHEQVQLRIKCHISFNRKSHYHHLKNFI